MKVSIMSPNFLEFHPGFSLTGIVKDQAFMLGRHGHEVDILVSDEFYGNEDFEFYPGKVTLKPVLPRTHQTDYARAEDISLEHIELSELTAERLVEALADTDIIFTHDILLTGWQLPYYLGLKEASEKVKAPWMHWLHSIPLHNYDWWNLHDLKGVHSIVSPNRVYRQLVAEAYKTEFGNVSVIPHIKDIRVMGKFKQETWDFIDKYPGVLQADVVQIYPASSDRLDMKRLREVILIFKAIKKMGYSVCLVCANQWATGINPKQSIDEYEELALRNGLNKREFVFTSGVDPKYDTGIPHDMLMELMSLSNLFIFPSYSESFGLVLPEAILSSSVLPVINSHLDVLNEVLGHRGLRFGFGSFTDNLDHPPGGEKNYMTNIANVIMSRMHNEESISTRSYCRQTYNMDSLYAKYYIPTMSELINIKERKDG